MFLVVSGRPRGRKLEEKAGYEVDVKSWPEKSSGSEPFRDTELKRTYQGEMAERRQLLSQVSCLSNVPRTLNAFIQPVLPSPPMR